MLKRADSSQLINGYEAKWWKEAVVYQIYPRSFQDSNGDGIGDLNGITERLDYLQRLGVNVIWLSPHFASPNADNGYDISDYRAVMADFGTMADFDRMLASIKQRHMRLIIDLVVNHTSDEHEWFKQSRKSKSNPYRDFYIWRSGRRDSSYPAANGAPAGLAPPNNYPSYFSGSAWQYNPATEDFYLHLFAVKQPDLNWDNARVRQEVYSLMRFWLDKGVDGFRMDVIPLISKQPGLPDLNPEQMKDPSVVFASGPHRDQYLQEMNREVLSRYDVMSVGEALGVSLEGEHMIVGAQRQELNMVFNFDVINLPGGEHHYTGYTVPDLKRIYDTHARVLGKGDWDTVFLSNHDNPRLVSSFGNDAPQFRAPSAKLLETMVLTLPGTPFLYQGDELGMINYPFTAVSQFDDIAVKNAYKAEVLTGKTSEAAFLENLRHTSRDNARTPMQWSDAPNAGFSSSPKTWLPVNPSYPTLNADSEAAEPNSVLNYTRQLIAFRARTPALTYGDYQDLDPSHSHVYAYTRTLGSDRYLVVLNLSSDPIDYLLPGNLKAATPILANYSGPEANSSTLHLRPWESRIYSQFHP